jgi:hypothetical protein
MLSAYIPSEVVRTVYCIHTAKVMIIFFTCKQKESPVIKVVKKKSLGSRQGIEKKKNHLGELEQCIFKVKLAHL